MKETDADMMDWRAEQLKLFADEFEIRDLWRTIAAMKRELDELKRDPQEYVGDEE